MNAKMDAMDAKGDGYAANEAFRFRHTKSPLYEVSRLRRTHANRTFHPTEYQDQKIKNIAGHTANLSAMLSFLQASCSTHPEL